jgi:CubicO group peptidase (beta-lactamase class C family)
MLLSHHSSIAKDNEGLTSFMTRIIPGGVEIPDYPSPFLKEYLVPGGIYYKPQVWLDIPPGEEMHYANIGFDVLGYLVEIISGITFETYCQENIFKPLNMNDTSFKFSNIDMKRAAVPYDFHSGKYIPIIHYDLLDSPAGGLRTTVSDLSHFLIAIMNKGIFNNKQILNESSIEMMHTIQYPNKDYNFEYGLGFQIWKNPGEILIGHGGGLFGVATKMVFRKSDNIGILLFTNREILKGINGIIFSLIEMLLFWRGSNYRDEINIEKLKQTTISNNLLLTDFS